VIFDGAKVPKMEGLVTFIPGSNSVAHARPLSLHHMESTAALSFPASLVRAKSTGTILTID
jgi:hypothetical protein